MVFPTSVGVFLDDGITPLLIGSFPHVRGGVSSYPAKRPIRSKFSPRPWGCFPESVWADFSTDVFPTSVGVFLFVSVIVSPFRRFPHVRGGVSQSSFLKQPLHQFSPRPWGCFCWFESSQSRTGVFPTSVGVFLAISMFTQRFNGFPHVRGGVSCSTVSPSAIPAFSPRPWGCFYGNRKLIYEKIVFPTSVGVFLIDSAPGGNTICFPHVRGGVSYIVI